MSTVIERVAEKIKEQSEVPDIKVLERMNYRLSDAMREGSSVTEQSVGNWTSEGDKVCALSATVCAAVARGYL